MTLPNEADGLSPNIDLAFPLTVDSLDAQQSLATRDTFDQPTVEALLKDQMQGSQGWQYANGVGYAGLPTGVPQVIGILAKVAEQFTGIPVSNWITQWTTNPVVSNLNTVITDSLAAIYQTSVNIQQFLGSLDFTDPDFDLIAAAEQFFDIILAPINKIATLIAGLLSPSVIPSLDASIIGSGFFSQSRITNLISDLLAKLGINVFNASAQAGPNTVLGPGFEDTTIPRNFGGAAGSGYSNERTHSGTMAFKIVSTGGWEEVDLIPVAGGTYSQDVSKSIKVTPGQKWFISAWCYARSANVGTNKAGLDALFTDSSGVNAPNYILINGVFTTVTISTWTKISGYVTVPAGYDRMLPFWLTDNPTTAGNTWHVDDAEVYQDITPAQSTGIQDLINGVTNFLQGLTGSSWGQAQAETALAATKLSIDQVAAQIQAINATRGGAVNSGVSVVVNYNDYANGSLPATHTATAFGTNTSTIGITNGRLHINPVNNGDYKYWEILYNAKQTNTDYQLAGITLTTLMQSGFGQAATNWIKVRSNSAQTRYIYAEFKKDDFNNLYFRLVAITASGGITWKDWTLMPWASTAWLEAGTAGGARIYRVWSGNQIVWTHTEVGSLSDMGASNRYCGQGLIIYSGVGSYVTAGDVSSFAFYDNQPPATVGSIAEVYRNSTSGLGTGGTGDREVPANTFDTTLRKSDDITLLNGKSYVVSITGTYRFTFCIHNVASMITSNIEPLMYVTPSGGASAIRKRGGHQYFDGATHSRLYGSFTVYLNAGDAVTPGVNSPNFTWSIAGEATGTFTWMSLALENKDLN